MSKTHSDGNAHIHIISVECPRHGAHRVIVAGLDDRADDTADFVLDSLIASGDPATIERSVMPLEQAAAMAEWGAFFDVGL